MIKDKIEKVQSVLKDKGVDGWLIYDFRRCNEMACQFLEISVEKMLTRRFFYWVPSDGEPIKVVSAIEQDHLNHLPGEKRVYRTWRELEGRLEEILRGKKRVMMEYSPRCGNPYVSKVDAGTADIVRGYGLELESSADLLQAFTSVWTQEQLESHYYAARVLDETAGGAWGYIAEKLRAGEAIFEYDVQQYILQEFEKKGCMSEGAPICGVNSHSADPHYVPERVGSSRIKKGDFILIDLWCKQKHAGAVYADITRVGVAAAKATDEQNKVFAVVRAAQVAAVALVKERFGTGRSLMGWEVDQACRDVIEEAGYGNYFIHRTGHNIGVKDHGDGAHLDNYETQDRRALIPGTCFSVEPGIYLPGKFGIRLEFNIFLHPEGRLEVTGGTQNQIETF